MRHFCHYSTKGRRIETKETKSAYPEAIKNLQDPNFQHTDPKERKIPREMLTNP